MFIPAPGGVCLSWRPGLEAPGIWSSRISGPRVQVGDPGVAGLGVAGAEPGSRAGGCGLGGGLTGDAWRGELQLNGSEP